MILSDDEIRTLAEEGMITPFSDRLVRNEISPKHATFGFHRTNPVMSFGLGSYGYDMRLGERFGVFHPHHTPLDPLNVTDTDLTWVETHGEPFIIRPKTFVLAHSIEYLKIPNNITAYVLDKSTYARCGIHAQNTVLEAGWEGQVTLELYNYLDRPVIIRPNQGVVQMTFHRGEACKVSYADRSGKYQGQRGVTLAKG
jgi:dCTP deaminase